MESSFLKCGFKPYNKGLVLSFIFLLLFSFVLVADESNDSGVSNLELAGSESFDYDVSNKIRKAKSQFNIGIGASMMQDPVKKDKVHFNASVIAGYSYFFHKSFGLRGYGIFDNKYNGFYGGLGIDAMWDFIQFEPFGMGVMIGTSMGYSGFYDTNKSGGFLAQGHLGFSLIFDGGKSRLELLARLPYNKVHLLTDFKKVGITYIIMYSYTF